MSTRKKCWSNWLERWQMRLRPFPAKFILRVNIFKARRANAFPARSPDIRSAQASATLEYACLVKG